MKALHIVSWILLIIGGLNWLLVGIGGLEWDVVGLIFGGQESIVSRIIYILVGVAAIVSLFTHRKDCKECGSGASSSPMM